MHAFLARFGALVSFILSGFDRVRFRGESRLLNHARGVESFLYQKNILFKDFEAYAEQLTKTLCRQTVDLAKQQGVPLKHLNSPETNKETTALQLADPQRLGRIAVLTCVETCSVYRIRKNSKGHIEPRKEAGKCLHYYHYFQHERFGLCYVRLQSWFPFRIHIGINGREWLYRQLQERGIDFTRRDNLLVSVQDPALAQQLLDEQRHSPWPELLNELVEPIHPLWSPLQFAPYYWMNEQTEWATDLIFNSPAFLSQWYPRFLQHGILTLACKDALRYLGRKVPANGYGPCTQEAQISLRERSEGMRLKFWYGNNSLKMYDKENPHANALRIETTINDPKDYRVFRTKEGEGEDATPTWQQMRQGVADMSRRAHVSNACNDRYLESLASVAETTPLGKMLEPLCKPTKNKKGRRVRALNPSGGPDGKLLRCLAQGEFLLNGFRNRDMRAALYGTARDEQEQRRQSSSITRQLAILKAHGLINKIRATHRYELTVEGTRIVSALLAAYQADVKRLADAA